MKYMILNFFILLPSIFLQCQTLHIDNQSSEIWTVNYYGISETVTPGNDIDIDISGANCHLDVTVEDNGCGTMSINLGGNNLSNCSNTMKCEWTLVGIASSPCDTTIPDAEILFYNP